MMQSASAVVQAFLDAIDSLHFDRAGSCLAETGFYYSSPLSTHRSGADFIADISRLGPIFKRLQVDGMLSDDSEVSALMTIQTHIPELANTRVALWASVAEGRIQRMEMVYDARAYQALFDAV